MMMQVCQLLLVDGPHLQLPSGGGLASLHLLVGQGSQLAIALLLVGGLVEVVEEDEEDGGVHQQEGCDELGVATVVEDGLQRVEEDEHELGLQQERVSSAYVPTGCSTLTKNWLWIPSGVQFYRSHYDQHRLTYHRPSICIAW